MKIYLILAALSMSLSVALFYFAHHAMGYIRLLRIKAMISHAMSQEEEIIDTTIRSHWHEKLDHTLLRKVRLTGIRLEPWQIMALLGMLMGLFGIAFSIFLNHWSGWLIGFVAAILIAQMILNALVRYRKHQFNRAFANAISVLVRMMRNGIGFEQALYKSVMNSNSLMFRDYFEQFFREKNTLGEEAAFTNLNHRIDSKELRIFAMAVRIGRQSGGQFSATLEKVEQTLRYRKKIQDKINVITREGMIGTYIVAGINVLLYFMIDMNFNGKVSEYFFTSEWGRWQLFGIGVWMIAGLAVNRVITRIQV